jgi:hypothetical protein
MNGYQSAPTALLERPSKKSARKSGLTKSRLETARIDFCCLLLGIASSGRFGLRKSSILLAKNQRQ